MCDNLAGALGGNRTFKGNPEEQAARLVRTQLRDAAAAGVPAHQLLESVAEALTGELGGYRSRLVTRALRDAWDSVEHINTEAAKAIERARLEQRTTGEVLMDQVARREAGA